MHLLGRSMKVTATYPDGSGQPLIYIDDWDFHWQGIYTFAKPVPLPGGTRIDLAGTRRASCASQRTEEAAGGPQPIRRQALLAADPRGGAPDEGPIGKRDRGD